MPTDVALNKRSTSIFPFPDKDYQALGNKRIGFNLGDHDSLNLRKKRLERRKIYLKTEDGLSAVALPLYEDSTIVTLQPQEDESHPEMIETDMDDDVQTTKSVMKSAVRNCHRDIAKALQSIFKDSTWQLKLRNSDIKLRVKFPDYYTKQGVFRDSKRVGFASGLIDQVYIDIKKARKQYRC